MFIPLIVWPLNAAFIMLQETVNYTFTGVEAFAFQVMGVCTSYVLVFVVLSVVFKTLIASKAENANEAY